MPEHVKPFILLVDDNVDELGSLADTTNRTQKVTCKVLEPGDVEKDVLKRADLVVLDYTLDAWTSRLPASPIGAIPVNGIALAAVLKQHAAELKTAPPTAFALISGNAALLGPLPAEQRPHVVSRLSSLEWFFRKEDEAIKNANQLISLSNAVRKLPKNVRDDLSSLDSFLSFLGVQKEDNLEAKYRDSVSICRPPIHYLAERSHGLVVIRWLLHRILPYTCFLVDEMQLAARFRVQINALSEALKQGAPLEAELKKYAYKGPLYDFDGPRWWRSGIEQWLWDSTGGRSAEAEAIRHSVNSVAGQTLDPLEIDQPVLTLNEDLGRESEFSEFSDVVAAQLDDWPSYAEPAYFRRSLLEEHDHLRMYVSAR